MKIEGSKRIVNDTVRLKNSIHLHFLSLENIYLEFQWRTLRTIDGSLGFSKNAFTNVKVRLLPLAANGWC